MVVERIYPAGEWEVAQDGAGLSAAGGEALRSYLESKGTRAALVVRGGRIAAEWYWEGTDASTQLLCYSTTKSFASTAVGLLVDDGVINLNEPAATYIPEWRENGRREVTIRHLLTMTSGIGKEDLRLQEAPDRMAFAISQPLVAPPGTVFDYNNCACSAISLIIRVASGREMADLLRERLYEPLGMTGLRHEMSAGRTVPYSGLWITARDAARFGYLFLRQGHWAGRQIVSTAWTLQACRSATEVNPDYGFLWWVNTRGLWKDLPRDAFSAQGRFGNDVTILPSHDLVVVRLVGNATDNAGNRDVNVNDYGALALKACDGRSD